MQQDKQQPDALSLTMCEDAAFSTTALAPSLPSTCPSTPAASFLASPRTRSLESSVTAETQPASRPSSSRTLQLASLLPSSCTNTAEVPAIASKLLRPPSCLETLPISFGPPPGLDEPNSLMFPVTPTWVCEPMEQRGDLQRDAEEGNVDTKQNLDDRPFSVTTFRVDGITTSQMLWRIAHPHNKFKSSCGCAMVSQSFSTGRLTDLRLMFAPGAQWAAEQAQKHKGKKSRKCAAEPLPPNGSLQLKFAGETCATDEVKLFLSVGSMRLGPYAANPCKCTSQVYELPSDWRREVSASGLIVLGVDIVG